MESLNIVHGCGGCFLESLDGRISEKPVYCPYCYVKYKSLKLKNPYHQPGYYPEYFDKCRPGNIYICSILGDICSPGTNFLPDIIQRASKIPAYFMLLTKSPDVYVKNIDVLKQNDCSRIWFGTSIESLYFAYRMKYLKKLQPDFHTWVEVEPLAGIHDGVDYIGIEYMSVSTFGFDQVYRHPRTGEVIKNIHLYNDSWIESIIHNPTLNKERLSIYDNVRRFTDSQEVKKHQNCDISQIITQTSEISLERLF